MRMLTKAILVGALLAWRGYGEQVVITAFDHNGRMTWTNPSSNAVSSVEWASDLSSGWQKDWYGLKNIRTRDATVTTNVPMFFRVTCWTNGLLLPQLRQGATATYAASNRLGQTWTMQDKVVGWANMPMLSNEYTIVFESGEYEGEFTFGRSTETKFYALMGPDSEGLFLQLAPPGTAWTNAAEPTIVYSVISTNETLTVPAGTFTNCLKMRRNHTDEAPPFDNEWYWVKPGVGLIRQHTETGGGLFYNLESMIQ